MTYLVTALAFSAGLLLSALIWSEIARRREASLRADFTAREVFLQTIATSEREAMAKQLDRERDMAAAERKELYSRIQAYDPNVGDFRAPDYVAPPSRPGDEVKEQRSFSEDDLGQLGLVTQADGTLRDTRNNALFESVEDWRDWQAQLRKRNLPENVNPADVQERGWEYGASVAKQEAAAKKGAGVTKN